MFIRHFQEQYWVPEARVSISTIKINEDLFSYQNKVSESATLDIVRNFDNELWMPITVNQKYYLLDGQHRLAAAKYLGLEYIDVVIQNTELLVNG